MADINIRVVPDDLRNAFKSVCSGQGKTMREVFLELMKEYVARKGKAK